MKNKGTNAHKLSVYSCYFCSILLSIKRRTASMNAFEE
uniref:Uncharacterized protein n=1 Tax=Rhizophora mucronata TaxID=61149 RepID=A0A2P2QVG3_RHIMU